MGRLSKHVVVIYDSLCSDDTTRDALRLAGPKELGETKIRNLGVHIGVKQDVARLEVTVDYFEL
jgi:hypothetical protein